MQYEDKEIRTFQVVEKNVYPMNEVPEEVMNIQGESRVTLITCTGEFIREKGGYQSRVIVILQLV
ncbi:class F sortase [Bacillus cereus]